jgi:hypothetical protein
MMMDSFIQFSFLERKDGSTRNSLQVEIFFPCLKVRVFSSVRFAGLWLISTHQALPEADSTNEFRLVVWKNHGEGIAIRATITIFSPSGVEVLFGTSCDIGIGNLNSN